MGLLSKAISVKIIAGRSGGLLRKLTMYSRELNRAKAVASAPRSRERGSSGLLKKSLLYLNLEKEEKQEAESLIIVDYTENIQRLMGRVELLAKDFSFLPSLFSLLIQELNIQSGALFLYSGNADEFVPWLHTGPDPGLYSALSFSLNRWKALAQKPLAKPFRIENDELFFSSVPLRLKKPLVMFPFIDRESLAGSLLVSDFRVHPAGAASLFEQFENISWKIGDIISLVVRDIRRIERPRRMFRSPAEALPELLGEAKSRTDSFYVVTLPLAPLFLTVKEKYRYFDREHLRRIILFVLNSSISLLGAGTPQRADEIVLVVKASDLYTPELLVHHLLSLLKDFFKGLFEKIPRLQPAKVFKYPQCGKIPEEIASEL